jgi:hypothetical protein
MLDLLVARRRGLLADLDRVSRELRDVKQMLDALQLSGAERDRLTKAERERQAYEERHGPRATD